MTASEIRIGNLIELDNEIIEVIAVSKSTIWHKDGFDSLAFSGFAQGILLTEEWMLKAGFTYHKSEDCVYFSKTYGKNGVIIITKDHHQKGFEFELGKGLFKSIEFVHNLQNGFYFLTDTELIIKS